MDRLLTDEEIEEWLLNRLGEGNKFEEFNREFCKDLGKLASDKTARWILDRVPPQIAYRVVEMEEELEI